MTTIEYLKTLPEKSGQEVTFNGHVFEFLWFLDDNHIDLSNPDGGCVLSLHKRFWGKLKLLGNMKYDSLFMDIARRTAQESNCVKYQVGAVAVRDGRMIAQGYNGTVSGFKNCSEEFEGEDMSKDSVRLRHSKWSAAFEVHAEMNVLSYCARKGISLEGTTLYCTHSPCNNCLKHLIQAGVREVIFQYDYTDNAGLSDRKELLRFITLKKSRV